MRPVTLACLLASLLPTSAFSQTLLSGDHSIDGNLCVGFGCTGSESFAGDQDLKIKEADPRIRFEDTSTNPALATVDWDIQTNQLSGPASFFAIRNVDLNTTILHLEDDAGLNAIYASDSGVGLGTSIPQAGLDVVGAREDFVRMERTNTVSGAQAWELGLDGNGSFYLGYDGAGKPIPIVVAPTAKTQSIVVDSSTVGINYLGDAVNFRAFGTGSNDLFFQATTGRLLLGPFQAPQAPLHINRTDGSARVFVQDSSTTRAPREMFKMENNGGSYFTLRDSSNGREWYFVHENNPDGRFFINHSDGGRQMALTRSGDMTIPGQLFTGGSCSAGCDRVFDADYPLPTIPEQAAMMRELKHLPNVGPTPEDGPFNLTAMTGGMLNELEKAHLYIAQLDEALAAERKQNARQAEINRTIEARLARLETLLEAQ
ncbi:hypothetical protein [Tropicibacter sp. S64]|uniref:hypothetical protein n=1 Tax=Tropicibacter sp. S64 TaxID=3415122 RepID=UPI003C7B54EC